MTELLIRQVGGKHETIQDSRPPFIPFRENAFWAEEANLPPKKLDGSVYFSESEGEIREVWFGKFAKCSVKLLRVERSVTVAIPLAEFAGQETRILPQRSMNRFYRNRPQREYSW